MEGLIHLYTGEGKGKTTAAIGLAIRAAGSGKRVLFGQFMKGRDTSELSVLESVPYIEVCRLTKDFGFFFQMKEEEKEEITRQHTALLTEMIEKVRQGKVDVLVMDELTYVCRNKLADMDMLKDFLAKKPEGLEVVITGRNPEEWLWKLADYITDMHCVRHPYQKGISARKGIEY